jgi:hypothetical protein
LANAFVHVAVEQSEEQAFLVAEEIADHRVVDPRPRGDVDDADVDRVLLAHQRAGGLKQRFTAVFAPCAPRRRLPGRGWFHGWITPHLCPDCKP